MGVLNIKIIRACLYHVAHTYPPTLKPHSHKHIIYNIMYKITSESTDKAGIYLFNYVICVLVLFPDHLLFVPLQFQADDQRIFQEIMFGDLRNADISKISSLLKQGVDPNIYSKVGLLNNNNYNIVNVIT